MLYVVRNFCKNIGILLFISLALLPVSVFVIHPCIISPHLLLWICLFNCSLLFVRLTALDSCLNHQYIIYVCMLHNREKEND